MAKEYTNEEMQTALDVVFGIDIVPSSLWYRLDDESTRRKIVGSLGHIQEQAGDLTSLGDVSVYNGGGRRIELRGARERLSFLNIEDGVEARLYCATNGTFDKPGFKIVHMPNRYAFAAGNEAEIEALGLSFRKE